MATNETLVTIAGSPAGVRGLVDGAYDEARFHQPLDIAFSPDESVLYVADYGNFAVRVVDPDTGTVTTLAVLDASPNCLAVDDNGLIWVNTIAPFNDAYAYEVGTPLDAAAEFALGTKVPNKGGTNPDALWVFEPDGNLIFRVELTSLAEVGPFSEPGAAGSLIGNSVSYTAGVTVSGLSGKQRNVQSGRPYGLATINNQINRLGTFEAHSDLGAGDGGVFDVTHGYWYDTGTEFLPYPVYEVVEDGTPMPDVCSPGGENCGDPCAAPDTYCCCIAAQARDGAFASNAGIVATRSWNIVPTPPRPDAYIFGLEYQYPSNSGMGVVDYEGTVEAFPGTNSDCIDDIDACVPANVPDKLIGYHGDINGPTASIRWSDAFGSTDFADYPQGFAAWGPNPTHAGWQLAIGVRSVDPDPYQVEVGTPMYQSTLGFLQTFDFASSHDLSAPVHRGMHRAPVRGVAYSATRDAWFFSTSSNSGGYGPYSKNVNGIATGGIGFHQIMQMVPYLEEDMAVEYELGGIVGTFDEALTVGGAGTLDTAWAQAQNPGMATLTEGTLEEPPGIDPFIPEVNPLPPEPDEIEVPLPPWVPGPGPYRES